MTRVARSQVTKMDFATSNMRGARIPLFVCGSAVLYNVTMGPVAGTAFNVTTISYNGSLDIGVFVDPAAVEDPADLRQCMEDAYADLIVGAPRRATTAAVPSAAKAKANGASRAAKPAAPRRAATKTAAKRASPTARRARTSQPQRGTRASRT
jgi:hypothetical protein